MQADKMLLLVGILLGVLFLSGCFGPAQQQVAQGNQQTNQNIPQGNTPIAAPGMTITPWGPLSANEVAGKDLECIGRPAGFTRAVYEESDLGYVKETNIVYLKSGNTYEGTKNYVKQKAEACGYKKYQEKSGSISNISIQNFQVTNYAYIEYDKGNEVLDIDVVTIKNSQGQEYTLLHITKTIEEETE
ncbi:MAG: hypothetical protein J7J87_04630 [Candidatus Diapherotrites archaeon]|nr:hypothetical protein [Candidatus Diapherotrites archaeon]